MSNITFNKLFFNNKESYWNFFINLFYPLGFIYPECECTNFIKLRCKNNTFTCSHCSYQICLFAGTVFQDNKPPLHTLLCRIFLFTTSKKVFLQKK